MDDLASRIGAISSLATIEDAARLQALADLWWAEDQQEPIEVWFRLFERLPEADEPVCWSILHGLEAHPDCDRQVVASVLRCPSRFPVLMVNRLLNTGVQQVDGVDLVALLRRVASDREALPSVREDAARFAER